MKERNLLHPEEKYTPPLVTSYDHGWQVSIHLAYWEDILYIYK